LKIFLVVVFFFEFVSQALAHRINLFAYPEGQQIKGEVYFVDGSPAKGTEVKAVDAEGKVLASTQTDSRGRFQLPCPDGAHTVRLVALAEAGHRAEMTLHLSSCQEHHPPAIVKKNDPSVPAEELARLVRAEVRRELAPIKTLLEEILKSLNRPSFKDIVGGIGYIVGLFGIILWVKARR